MKSPLYRKGCGPQRLGSPAKQIPQEGRADEKIMKIAKDDATSYRAKQRKTQRQVKKVDKAVEQPSRRKDRMERAETLLEREGVKSPAKFKGANSKNSDCWKGYKKQGTKPSPTKPGVTVNNCVKK